MNQRPGLIKYLACIKNGEEFTDIVTAASMNKFTYTKDEYRIDDPLHEEIYNASIEGNVHGGDDKAFCDYVKTTYGLNRDKSQVFKDGKAATVKGAFEFAAHDGLHGLSRSRS